MKNPDETTPSQPANEKLPSWVRAAIANHESGKEEVALDIIFRNVNAMLEAGEFSKCDDLLARLAVSDLSGFHHLLLMAFLSITLAAADQLPQRELFYCAVLTHLRDNPRADKLLGGLAFNWKRHTVATNIYEPVPPWKMKPLDEWAIVGMNHYHQNGKRLLFVAMVKDGKCIKEEGDDDRFLWNRLWHKAAGHA